MAEISNARSSPDAIIFLKLVINPTCILLGCKLYFSIDGICCFAKGNLCLNYFCRMNFEISTLKTEKRTVLHSLLHQTVLIHSLTIPNYFYSFLFRSFSVHEIML